jgi:hypothetical protein
VSAFTELDWGRIDVWAIVTYGGLATIDDRRHLACRDWLLRHGYGIHTLDCRPGLAVAIPELGRLLRWEQQFGYSLKPDSPNLDALRDGFEFCIPEGTGCVFAVIGGELAWQEDSRWFRGLLSIAMEQSRQQLALGRRFFTLLVVPERSPLIGAAIDEIAVPALFWDPCSDVHEFTA